MRIYIRHAPEIKRSLLTQLKDDPEIQQSAIQSCQRLCSQLIDRFGRPTKIISSPLARCRLTAVAMAEQLNMDVEYDPQISTHIQDEDVDISWDSLRHSIPIGESSYQFEHRIRCHNDSVRCYDSSRKPVWIITHGIVISKVMNAMGFKTITFPYLASIVIREDNSFKSHTNAQGNTHCRSKKIIIKGEVLTKDQSRKLIR